MTDPITTECSIPEWISLFQAGLLGFKETRTCIAAISPAFKKARDPELDKMMTEQKGTDV